MPEAEIGIFGGSGFYSLLEGAEEVTIETPYGASSSSVMLGEIAGRKVGFMARHGLKHQHPAHAVNYRANVWAMKSLGVTRIIGPGACGSLQKEIAPGHFVVLDQWIDRTNARKDTYYDGPITTHISAAEPYCPELRSIVVDTLDGLGYTYHKTGTQVVIQGPRFSTIAESRWFSGQGWHTIGMTQYPESMLAKELDMCYTGIALVTDYDAGLEDDPDLEAVTAGDVLEVFHQNIERVKQLIHKLVPAISETRACDCESSKARGRFL